MKLLAILATAAWIWMLFRMDRNGEPRPSKAVWIPALWLLIVASRPVSMWLHVQRAATLAQQYTDSSPVDAAVYAALMICGVLVLNRRAGKVLEFARCNLPILVFFLYCGVSVGWADDPLISMKRWVKALGDLVMVLLLLTDAHPVAAVKRAFRALGFVLLPLSVLLIEFYPGIGSTYLASDRVVMYTGVTTFKNELGLLCLVTGLAALWQGIRVLLARRDVQRRRMLLAQGLTLVTALWLLFKADSMTSLAGLGLAGAVMLGTLLRPVRKRPGMAIVLAGSAVGLAVFALFLDTAGTLVHSLGRSTTLTGRTQIWAAVLAQPVNPLLGTGFESFWMGNRMQSVWDLSQTGIEEAHNGFLEMYLNLGWVGLALFGVVVGAGCRNVLRTYRANRDAGRLWVGLFTAGLIYSLTEAGFRMLSPIWIGFLMCVASFPWASEDQGIRAAAGLPSRLRTELRVRILQ